MLGELKPYPAYKDFGVPWMGDVPEHWELPRLGALQRDLARQTPMDFNNVFSVLRERGVIPYAEKGMQGSL